MDYSHSRLYLKKTIDITKFRIIYIEIGMRNISVDYQPILMILFIVVDTDIDWLLLQF